MVPLEARIRAWSHQRQRLGRSGSRVSSVLHDIIGVYATQPTALLTLAARVPGLAVDEYRALDSERSAIRVSAMRLSSHLVPVDTSARIIAATRRPKGSLAWLWRGIGLSDEEYALVGAAILAAAREPVTVAAIRTRLAGEAGALLDRHPQAPTLIVRAMRSDGQLLAIAPDGLRSNAFAYVATDAWLGRPFESIDQEAARSWLAGEYLRAFGPARAEDFRWWSGATGEQARAALAGTATVELDGRLLLRADDRDDFERVGSGDDDALDLLPLWDMYTMGYAPDGRSRFVRTDHRARAYDTSGNGLGLVLSGGSAVAAWGLRFDGRSMDVEIDSFGPLDSRVRAAIDDRLAEIAALLGASAVRLVFGAVRGPGGPRRRSHPIAPDSTA